MKDRIKQVFFLNPVLNSDQGIGESRAEAVIAYKANVSLLAIWTAAFIICILFFWLNFSQPGADLITMSMTPANNNYETASTVQDMTLENTDAFVFVNVDKKFFLTRFPFSATEEQSNVLENKDVTASKATGIKTFVIRKTKKPADTGGDFSIKPVPGN